MKIFVFISAGKASVFKFGDFLSFCPGYPPTYEMPLVLQFCGPEGPREVQLQRSAGMSAHGSEEYGEGRSDGKRPLPRKPECLFFSLIGLFCTAE